MKQSQSRRFGAWLRERRQAAGLSTVQLAEKAGTTDGTITRIEQGAIASPDPQKLSRIADVLQLELADVYAMANYAVPDQLPSFHPYLRSKYSDLPASAVIELDEAFEQILERHGYEPEGPKPGQDEIPEDESFD